MSLTSCLSALLVSVSFFFNDTATTEIYTYLHTLSLHDALPISVICVDVVQLQHHSSPRYALMTRSSLRTCPGVPVVIGLPCSMTRIRRSEEHTSELQSLMRISYAVFCLKKKTQKKTKESKNTQLYDTLHSVMISILYG